MALGALISSYLAKFTLNKLERRQYMMVSDLILISGALLG